MKQLKLLKQLVLFYCTLILIGNTSVASADTASDTETLLNWAESNFTQYFPTQQATQTLDLWLFRFYPETGVYAGVNSSDNGVYLFGGPWGNISPTYIDSLSNLLEIIQVGQNGKLTNVRSMVTGGGNFIIKADGTVWSWGGNNISGQLGDGTNEVRSTPVKVVGLTDVIQVVSGGRATIALKNDGTVWAWGSNILGILGNGTGGIAEVQYTPIKISGLSDVIAIGENDTFSHSGFYAIKQDGTLWTWGCQANKIIDHSVLTCPILESPRLPIQLSKLFGVIDFQSRTTGGTGVLNSYYVLESDGTVWAWGNNFAGQLGNGTNSNTILPHGITGTDRNTPEQVTGLTDIKEIASMNTGAGIVVFALKKDGTVWAWGDNSSRQLGTGMTTSSVDSPTQVSGLTGIIKISVDTSHSLALKNDGTVWAWGSSNLYGATGTAVDRITPTPTPVQLVGLFDIIDIKASLFSSIALKEDGTVWGWGSGFLKDRTEVVHFTPTQMCNLPGITKIVGFDSESSPYLLRNDGTVWNAYFDRCTQL